MKDWTGNNKSIFTCNGASNHSDEERQIDDYYATEPKAVELLLEQETFSPYVWEIACGEGHISEVLKSHGYKVRSTDIVNRGYPDTEVRDFFDITRDEIKNEISRDIITNPPYKCFSDDTECYTKMGWKTYKQLNYNDEILSVNPKTLELEWSSINEIFYYEVNEDVYHFKKSHMDILCTKDHRMFAYNKDGIVYKDDDLILSQNIRTSHFIPRTGYSWNGNKEDYFILPAINGTSYNQPVYKDEIKIPMEYWLKFFGMWLADGYCRHTKNSQGNHRKTTGIKQKADNAEVIRQILSKLPFDYKEYEDKKQKNPCINFEIHNEQLWEYLKQFGKASEKFIPREIKELDINLLNIFIDSYFNGDGSKYKSPVTKNIVGRIYRTISKHLAEDIQEILLKLGYLSHITTQEYTILSGEKTKLYTILYSPNSHYNKIFYPSAKKSVEHYNGGVWCVNLNKNGVFLLRRNGKEFISGNCAQSFIQHALDISSDGTKIAMFLKLTFLESKSRKELFEKYPFKTLYVSSSRLQCAKNGDFKKYSKSTGTAVAYGWYVWEKGFKGDPIIKWIN